MKSEAKPSKPKGRPRTVKVETPVVLPEPLEVIVKEVLSELDDKGEFTGTEIDPMDFLEAPAERPDAPAQADEAFGAVQSGDPESPHAVRTGLFTRKPISADVSKLRFEETHYGPTIPIVMGDTRPSAADLDAVAEEQRIAEQTGMQPLIMTIEKAETELANNLLAKTGHEDLEYVSRYAQILTDVHGNRFDPATHTVPVTVPVAPAPRRLGCSHGFGNSRLCPQCRANGA